QWVAEGEAIPPISSRPPDPSLRAVFLDESHIGQIAGTRKWIARQELIRRLRGGQHCIGVFTGETLAAYMWADPFECNHPPNRAPLSAGEAYLYEAYSLPEFRGRDVAPFMRRSAYDLLRSLGFSRFYSITDYFNASAARFKQKLGARPICLYLYLKLGKRWSGNWKIHSYGAKA
ncbi:MAG: GNAT family N-acetyltransferase, partial [Gammaproteobacteria bacterium]